MTAVRRYIPGPWALWLLVFAACAPVGFAKPGHPQDTSGNYVISVRGFWTGQGTANVTGSTVEIHATVKDEAGNVGELVVSGLKIQNHRFSGTGTVLGIPMTIEGRVDPIDVPPGPTKKKKKGKPQPTEDAPVLSDGRIGATFFTADHAGRLAGSAQ